VDDSKEYTKTREAMGIVGINLEEQVVFLPFS
jgi:myosin heavy subunit